MDSTYTRDAMFRLTRRALLGQGCLSQYVPPLLAQIQSNPANCGAASFFARTHLSVVFNLLTADLLRQYNPSWPQKFHILSVKSEMCLQETLGSTRLWRRPNISRKNEHVRAASGSLTSIQVLRLLWHRVRSCGRKCSINTNVAIRKTRIAVDYAYQEHEAGKAVFWIYAGSLENANTSINRIMQYLKITGAGQPDADNAELLRSYLADQQNAPWLVVVDNGGDERVLSADLAGSTRNVQESMPQVPWGIVLLTSRDRLIGAPLTAECGDLVEVSVLSRIAASRLLKAKVRAEELARSSVEDLVDYLGCLPLAIAQAAGYIYATKQDAASYLEDLRQQPLMKLADIERKTWAWRIPVLRPVSGRFPSVQLNLDTSSGKTQACHKPYCHHGPVRASRNPPRSSTGKGQCTYVGQRVQAVYEAAPCFGTGRA
jgi:hypothetical protein